jgi:hypothetical protein
MNKFKKYRRKAIAELRKIVPGEDLTGVSISDEDKKLMKEFPNIFSLGYVARNPKNHKDMWYVVNDYFLDNFEEIE